MKDLKWASLIPKIMWDHGALILAFKAGKADVMADLLGDGATLTPEGQSEMTNISEIRTYWDGIIKRRELPNLTFETVKIELTELDPSHTLSEGGRYDYLSVEHFKYSGSNGGTGTTTRRHTEGCDWKRG